MPIQSPPSLKLGHGLPSGRFPIVHDLNDVGKLPQLVSDARRHRWRDTQGLVDAHEIVVHEVDGDGVRVVLDLLLNAFVSLVKRRMPIRMDRFCRSA